MYLYPEMVAGVLGVSAPDGPGPDDGLSTPGHQLGQVSHHRDCHIPRSVDVANGGMALSLSRRVRFTGWLSYCVADYAETLGFCFYDDRYVYCNDGGR